MTNDSYEEYITIGELARTIGVTTRTLCYYEEVGIMESPRRLKGGSRLYTASGVRKLKSAMLLRLSC